LKSAILAHPASVAGKDEHLEAHIGRQEILHVERTPIGGAYHDLWDNALADNQILGCVLIFGVGDRGWGVVNPDATSNTRSE